MITINKLEVLEVVDFIRNNYDINAMKHSDLWSKCFDYIAKNFNLPIGEKSASVTECVKELEAIKGVL